MTGRLARGKSIRKVGPRALAWKQTRAEKVASDVNDEGLIRCEDYKLGLPRCGIARQPEDMDLHHAKGRDGNLLTDKRFLVWLTRKCHDEAHSRNSRLTSPEAKDDAER
jgi:hypothetical protein